MLTSTVLDAVIRLLRCMYTGTPEEPLFVAGLLAGDHPWDVAGVPGGVLGMPGGGRGEAGGQGLPPWKGGLAAGVAGDLICCS